MLGGRVSRRLLRVAFDGFCMTWWRWRWRWQVTKGGRSVVIAVALRCVSLAWRMLVIYLNGEGTPVNMKIVIQGNMK